MLFVTGFFVSYLVITSIFYLLDYLRYVDSFNRQNIEAKSTMRQDLYLPKVLVSLQLRSDLSKAVINIILSIIFYLFLKNINGYNVIIQAIITIISGIFIIWFSSFLASFVIKLWVNHEVLLMKAKEKK